MVLFAIDFEAEHLTVGCVPRKAATLYPGLGRNLVQRVVENTVESPFMPALTLVAATHNLQVAYAEVVLCSILPATHTDNGVTELHLERMVHVPHVIAGHPTNVLVRLRDLYGDTNDVTLTDPAHGFVDVRWNPGHVAILTV